MKENKDKMQEIIQEMNDVYICPVCGKKSKTENGICTSCRFDRSRNYEAYATISPLKGKNNHAISKKKQNYEAKQRPGAFVCSKCKSIRFHIFPETNKILCVDCGTEIKQEELPWKRSECKAKELVPNQFSKASAVSAEKKSEKTAPAQHLSPPTISTSAPQPALTISPFALQKFPFVSVKSSHFSSGYIAAIKENGEITHTGQIHSWEILEINKWKNLKALAGDFLHTVALKSDGTVAAIGANFNEELDVCLWKNIVAITTGRTATGSYTLALRNDRTVVATKAISCRDEIQQWNDIVSVAAGLGHIVGLKSDGTIVAAGDNLSSQQCDVAGWKNIKSIACGEYHTVGLTGNGTVVATDYPRCPFDVYGSKWNNIIAISCGHLHVVGLRADGMVVATGSNNNGQCNTSSWSDIIDISCTGNITVGLKKDGTITATGKNKNIAGYEDLFTWRDIIAIECRGNHLIGLKADGTVCVSGYKDLSGVRIPDVYKR